MIEQLGRAQLARLARENMLSAHFNSRTGYAALQMNHGESAYEPVAIENWMASSPVYTQRMQQAMKLRGTSSVETIFKGMQLEVGLAHQYFDARFEMTGVEEGQFWLNSCGPLLEVEPRGDDAVRTMCHSIEDPTFDATAMATNPRARVRPVHRPPRVPGDRTPHCLWRVFVDESAEALIETEITARMRNTALANLPIVRGNNNEPGGMDYYDGPLLEQMQLEVFSQSALAAICREIAIQNHLLINSLWWAIADRYTEDAADAVATFQMEGACWMMSERLCSSLGLEGNGLEAMERVVNLHPAFQPQDYWNLQVELRDDENLHIALAPTPDSAEDEMRGWSRLLRNGEIAGLLGLVRGVNPRASVEADADGYLVKLEASAEPAEDPLSVQIARGSVLYKTQLQDHIQLLEVSG